MSPSDQFVGFAFIDRNFKVWRSEFQFNNQNNTHLLLYNKLQK